MVKRNRNFRFARRRFPRKMRRIPRTCFNGIRTRGPADPRNVNLNPWKTATVETFIANNGADVAFAFSSAELYSKAADQLQIPVNSLQLKVHKIDVWDRERDLFVHFYDYQTNQSIMRLRDRGTYDRPSHVHFVLPKTTSSHILANSPDIGVVSGASGNYMHSPISGQSDVVILHVTLSYRLNSTSDLAFFPLKVAVKKPTVTVTQNKNQPNSISKTAAN